MRAEFDLIYNVIKQKSYGVLKALKKVRYWLYGVRFILKIDANVLLAQLNRSDINFFRAIFT